ncbi:MAG: hypothetical protein NVSMB66_2390 [Candidatus Doudnabacteria bacterium]
MPQLIEVKRRLKSVKSTKKITRAMQMISAAKMRKAQAAAMQSRTYSSLAWEIITNLVNKVDPKYHALLSQKSDIKKVAVILISTNRGQVGGFNTNLVNLVKKELFLHKEQMQLAAELVVVGRKGRDAMIRLGNSVVADFPKQDKTIGISEILPISKMIIEDYLAANTLRLYLLTPIMFLQSHKNLLSNSFYRWTQTFHRRTKNRITNIFSNPLPIKS